MKAFELISFPDKDALARAAASAWLDEIAAASQDGKPHYIALSGGRIMQKFFPETVEQSRRRNLLLSNAHFFWADERCVPPNDPESNFADAQNLLFEPLKIAESQIHRIRGEEALVVAVGKAIEEVRRLVPFNADGQPILDLIFLGMGEDGHVASLFPGEPERLVSDKTVFRAVTNSPKPPPNRITLGYSAIAAARQVWVLVSGVGKETSLRESLRPEGETPLAKVIRSRKKTQVFTDVRI